MNPTKLQGDGTDFLKGLILDKKDFTIKKTGYSLEIILNGKKYLFSKTDNTQKTFFAHSKIKADIRKSNLIIDSVPHQQIKFYDVRNFMEFNQEIFYPEIINVDIKNAYPQTLFNFGCLTENTFNYLNTEINKIDRLKAVGMIATNKIIYEFKKGKCFNSYTKSNKENRNLFKAVCFEVGKNMNDCAQLIKDDFLFFWVDGIYFLNEKNILPTELLLNSNNYKTTTERLTDFYAKLSNNIIFIEFKKDNKLKKFSLPLNERINNTELNKINKLFNLKK